MTTIKHSINPFSWHYADDQGVLVEHPTRLFVSGQTAMSDAGEPQHAGDLTAQAELAMDNVAAVLAAGGMSLSDMVKLDTHVCDLAAFNAEAAGVLARRFEAAKVSPAGVLSQVSALAHPDLLIEMDAIAVA